jgi:hypothetical protein
MGYSLLVGISLIPRKKKEHINWLEKRKRSFGKVGLMWKSWRPGSVTVTVTVTMTVSLYRFHWVSHMYGYLWESYTGFGTVCSKRSKRKDFWKYPTYIQPTQIPGNIWDRVASSFLSSLWGCVEEAWIKCFTSIVYR